MYGGSQNSFADLMSMAKQNADAAKRKAANSSLFPDRPKKVDPKQVKLKEGVAKFLAKQAEEERRKKEQEKLKKEKLLQLRQQDRKATNRVNKMLKMTKSANKSCVDDAKDCLNESVAAQGEIQPDEDDYGYTSNYADEMHKKMMEKYKSIPVKPAFPQTSSVPVPKSHSLKNGSGWRKNGHSQDYEDDRGYSSPEQERQEEQTSRKPVKPSKPNRPPPPDYRLLLQMAGDGKFAPPAATKPVVDKNTEGDEFEFGRPMTAKEKKAFLEQKEMKERLARRMEGKSDKNNNSSSSGGVGSSNNDGRNGKMPSFKIPKGRSNVDEAPSTSAPPAKKPKVSEPEPSNSKPVKEMPKFSKQSESSSSVSSKPSSISNGRVNGMKPSSSMNGTSRPTDKLQKQNAPSSSPPASKSKGDLQRDRPSQPKPDPRSEKVMQDRMQLIKEKPRYLAAFDGKEREREKDKYSQKKQPLLSNESNKPKPGSSREMHSAGMKERDYESREKMRMGSKMPPPEDRNRYPKDRDRDEVRPSQRKDMGPPSRRDVGPAPRRDMGPRRDMSPSRRDPTMKPRPRMRDDTPPRMRPPRPSYRGRAVIDSDDEYDSEMDDFIDDSEVDMGSISAEISKIFNYDKRKYRYDESDDECMESSVHQQMMEERRSLRLGIQEDLEDMAREEEEKRRMKLKMKKRR